MLLSEPSCAELDLPSWLEEKLKADWTQQKLILLREDLQRKYRRVKFTGTTDFLTRVTERAPVWCHTFRSTQNQNVSFPSFNFLLPLQR